MAFLNSGCGGYLSGIFRIDGKKYIVNLTNESLSWKLEKSHRKCQIIPLEQLIAFNPCDCMTSHKSKEGQCRLCSLSKLRQVENYIDSLPFPAMAIRIHFAIHHRKHLWKLKSIVFCPEESSLLKVWFQALRDAISGLVRPKKLLVFVNPYGGRRRGIKIYEKTVAPIFHLAGIDAHTIITLKQNHAKELIEEINIHKFDGIVCVGGDGSFSEVLNGLIVKTQMENDININDSHSSLKVPDIPVGVIPAGSTNCAAYCSMNTDDPLSAALIIVMGNRVNVDVCAVHHRGNLLRYAAIFLSYGFFGDLIVESEKLRFLGPKRYDVLGFKNALKLRKYKGELQLKMSANSEHSSWTREFCRIGCETCLKGKVKAEGSDPRQNLSPDKIRWRTVQGKFVALSSAIMSGACARTEFGVSPFQHLGNGYCDVIIVCANSRWQLFKYFLTTATALKDPLSLDFVQAYRVEEFMFNPGTTEDKTPQADCIGVQENYQQLKSSIWQCDGEAMPEISIHAKVHCQLLPMFGYGLEDKSSDAICCGLIKRNLT